jgi:acyl-CoA thioesterase FadM
MTGFMTRWVVCEEHRVDAADVDTEGRIRHESVERWVDAACRAYLDCCDQLRQRGSAGFVLRSRIAHELDPARLGSPDSVVVSATATEVRPDSFIVAVRVRGAFDGAVDAACEVFVEDPATGERSEIGREIRDELIALEHAARHFN